MFVLTVLSVLSWLVLLWSVALPRVAGQTPTSCTTVIGSSNTLDFFDGVMYPFSRVILFPFSAVGTATTINTISILAPSGQSGSVLIELYQLTSGVFTLVATAQTLQLSGTTTGPLYNQQLTSATSYTLLPGSTYFVSFLPSFNFEISSSVSAQETAYTTFSVYTAGLQPSYASSAVSAITCSHPT